MKKLKWIVLGLTLTGFAALGLSACGGSSTCSDSSECDGDKVCWKDGGSQGQCVKSCNNDPTVCGSSSTCQEQPDGVKACVPNSALGDSGVGDVGVDGTGGDGGNGGNGEGCSEGDCEAGQFCWNEEKCIAEYKFVHILDTTETENATKSDPDEDDDGTNDAEEICDNENDNITTGSDLYGVALVGSDNQIKAWGEAVNWTSFTNKPGRKKFGDILNGSKFDLRNQGDVKNACPAGEFGEDNIAALGCGGAVIVGFKNSEGNWMTMKPGESVRVFEYGASCFGNCNPDDNYARCGTEYYEVGACPSDKAASDLNGLMLQNPGEKFDGCSDSGNNLKLSSGNGISGHPVDRLWPDVE